MKFKKSRQTCLKLWLTQTRRKRHINDATYDTIECSWQTKFVTRDMHNSFFCSIAEWNTHITDLLKDTSYDKYEFSKKGYRSALFRHYTRILLIVSEIITDFQNFIELLEGVGQTEARNMLTNPKASFCTQELFDFINAICKHKVGQKSFNKYHYYNHHIEYTFLDAGLPVKSGTINIKNVKIVSPKPKDSLEVPKLHDIIEQVLFAYSVVNNSLEKNYKSKIKILQTFERPE